MDHVVVDVEIAKCIGEDGITWNDTDKVGISCAVVYEDRGDRFRVFGPNDLNALQDRLLVAERITTYNGTRFDFPVIWRLPARRIDSLPLALPQKNDDLLARIWRAMGLKDDEVTNAHKGWGLGIVAHGTLGIGKIGHGELAPKMYQEGRWQELVSYCADDVALTRDLARFIDRYHYVLNGKTGQKVYVPEWRG